MPFTLKSTYSITKDAPPAVSWDRYVRVIYKELRDLLEANASEAQMQALLERHPCLIPGAHGTPMTSPSGHSPFPAAVISQPPLPTFGGKIPDFMWITMDSVTLSPVLIEIEKPSKGWFRKNGQPTHHLTQARDQLETWKVWFGKPSNIHTFYDFYRIDGRLREHLFKPLYLLIYGRRADSNRTTALANKRGAMQTEHTAVVSFDRLTPSRDASNYMCVKIGTEGYRAVSVPPTLRLGPLFAGDYAQVADKAIAVKANSYLSAKRKKFLVERMPFWDKWAKLESKGIQYTGDFE